MRITIFCAAATLAWVSVATATERAVFLHPLDVPAVANTRLTSSQLTAVTRAGDRVVGVGARGLIIYSDDAGRTWTQAVVPVGVDLLAVQFPTALQGWAVGHNGVVLHSQDGGATWQRQSDGRAAKDLLVDYYQRKVREDGESAQRFLDDVNFFYSNGPEQALLGVWFEDERHGFVCGSFGTLFATEDGGRTWLPWNDRVSAPEAVHLNAIRGIGGNVFIASERGVVFRLDRESRRFVPAATGYAGSFFALAGIGDGVIAFGLRGNAFRSADGGRAWQRLDTPVAANFTSADVLADGRIVAVTQSGHVLVGSSRGESFRRVAPPHPMMFSGVSQGDDGSAVVVGMAGLDRVPLN